MESNGTGRKANAHSADDGARGVHGMYYPRKNKAVRHALSKDGEISEEEKVCCRMSAKPKIFHVDAPQKQAARHSTAYHSITLLLDQRPVGVQQYFAK